MVIFNIRNDRYFLSIMAAYLRIDRYLSWTRLKEITWFRDVFASVLSIKYEQYNTAQKIIL